MTQIDPEALKDKIPCAHCDATGKCCSGRDGESCGVCLRKSQPLFGPQIPAGSVGLVCSVCKGFVYLEPTSIRLEKRIVPVLAMLIVYVALALVLLYATPEKFDQILAFAGRLIVALLGTTSEGVTQP